MTQPAQNFETIVTLYDGRRFDISAIMVDKSKTILEAYFVGTFVVNNYDGSETADFLLDEEDRELISDRINVEYDKHMREIEERLDVGEIFWTKVDHYYDMRHK